MPGPVDQDGMSQSPAQFVLIWFLMAGTAVVGGCSKSAVPGSSSERSQITHEPKGDDLPVAAADSAVTVSESDASPPESSTDATVPRSDGNDPKRAEINRESLYRIPQNSPELNHRRLAAAGIHVLESRRLILLTDLPPEIVQDLPQLADHYFEFLEQVCGKIRPARSGVDFRAIGCLINDFELFQSAGLVPDRVVSMRHGQQVGYQFWMRNQADEYYRRHLLLHEFAHVYMTCDTGLSNIPDGWFMEGAAEVFATHSTFHGRTTFGVMPSETTEFGGWGRISAIRPPRRARSTPIFERRKIPSMQEVQFPTVNPPVDDVRYAWWWALCWMLSNHPEYNDDWAGLCYSRGQNEFFQKMTQIRERHGLRLSADWLLFAESLCEGFDPGRAFAKHRDPDQAAPKQLVLFAERGWQDSGRDMLSGDVLSITCTGRCTIEETTSPWISEPDGVTLEYRQGHPLGQVVAALVSPEAQWISQRIIVGSDSKLTTPQAGRLWLQINDSAASRAGNTGSYAVTIHEASALTDNGQ